MGNCEGETLQEVARRFSDAWEDLGRLSRRHIWRLKFLTRIHKTSKRQQRRQDQKITNFYKKLGIFNSYDGYPMSPEDLATWNELLAEWAEIRGLERQILANIAADPDDSDQAERLYNIARKATEY